MQLRMPSPRHDVLIHLLGLGGRIRARRVLEKGEYLVVPILHTDLARILLGWGCYDALAAFSL